MNNTSIAIGDRVQRNGVRLGTAFDYTNGRQGEVVGLKDARVQVKWTHEQTAKKPNEHTPLTPRDVKRTWVKASDVFKI